MSSKMTVRKVTRKKNDRSPVNRKENNSTRDKSCDKTSDHGEVSLAHREDNSAMLSSSATKESASINTRTSKAINRTDHPRKQVNEIISYIMTGSLMQFLLQKGRVSKKNGE